MQDQNLNRRFPPRRRKKPRTYFVIFPKIKTATLSVVLSAVALCVSAITWLATSDLRNSQREELAVSTRVLKAQEPMLELDRIRQADNILKNAEKTGVVSTVESPSVRYALDLLSKTGHMIQINTDYVEISDMAFGCSFLDIQADTVDISEVHLFRTSLDVKADHVNFFGTRVDESFLGLGNAGPKSHVRFSNAQLLRSRITARRLAFTLERFAARDLALRMHNGIASFKHYRLSEQLVFPLSGFPSAPSDCSLHIEEDIVFDLDCGFSSGIHRTTYKSWPTSISEECRADTTFKYEQLSRSISRSGRELDALMSNLKTQNTENTAADPN